ncbi:MAG: hypothetical protein DRP78_05165 [Candidatus Omnitrophota bacterium]|nr:MAG: hypothetical protein DRP78_05165 [Candidatus Omnitrophota bacterium]
MNKYKDNVGQCKTDKTIVKKSIVLPKEDSSDLVVEDNFVAQSLMNNEAYINYYQQINQQLRASVVCPQYFSNGDVVLSFGVNYKGELKFVEIVDNQSSDDVVLRNTALQIVKESSPFPPFPESLCRMQLTFNVVICFRGKS